MAVTPELRKRYNSLKIRNPGNLTRLPRAWRLSMSDEGEHAADMMKLHAGRQAERYDTLESNYYISLPVVSMRHLRKMTGIKRGGLNGALVLDVGSGPASNAAMIKNAEPGASIVAIDRSYGMIKRIQREHPGITALEAEVGEKPLTEVPEGSAALTCCFNLIDSHPKPKALIRELSRLTKPGGYVLLSSPWPIKHSSKLGKVYTHPPDRIHPEGAGRYEALKALEDEAARQGLRLVSWSQAPHISISIRGLEAHKNTVVAAFKKL